MQNFNTKKLQIFINEYLKNLNVNKACELAKIKEENINEFLNNPKFVNTLKHEINKRIQVLRVEKAYIVQNLLRLIEFSLHDEEILDKEGAPTGKIKLRDASVGLKAIEMLCKNLGLDVQNTTPEASNKGITISNLDETKL